jgi:hypothetical protein
MTATTYPIRGAVPLGRTAVIAKNWGRCLLSGLGAAELLMAAGAAPALMAVGALGATALLSAAWVRTVPPATLGVLVALGTVPFAVLGWTAIVPVPLLLAAAALAVPIVQQARRPRADGHVLG